MKRKDKNNKSEKISYSFKYVNLKEYLKKDNFIVLHKLGIEVKKTKCTEYDIRIYKIHGTNIYKRLAIDKVKQAYLLL